MAVSAPYFYVKKELNLHISDLLRNFVTYN